MPSWRVDAIAPAFRLTDGQAVIDGAGLSLPEQIVAAHELVSSTCGPATTLALVADNSPDWLILDLACHAGEHCLVPLPGFFTPVQMAHSLDACAADALACPDPAVAARLGFTELAATMGSLSLYRRPGTQPVRHPKHQKVTFTSGTTAEPKGIGLSSTGQWELAGRLTELLAPLDLQRHLCLLPLAVLLENVAGAYTSMCSGATLICPALAQTGLSGSSQFDAQRCMDAIARHQAHSVILLPQMLRALLAHAHPDDPRLESLRFMALGGAKTPQGLIHAARQRDWPVYEGYGLSECGSVVCLNIPGKDKPGSVGCPLPGRDVRIADDGEILVRGHASTQYLGGDTTPCPDNEQGAGQSDWLPTGDLGDIDADGFVHINGRKKNLIITSFGRNVSPEWPESLLIESPLVAQAFVMGDGQARLQAVIVPTGPSISLQTTADWVQQINQRLPDYARIGSFALSGTPFTSANGLATANGRPRRDALTAHFSQHAFIPLKGDPIELP